MRDIKDLLIGTAIKLFLQKYLIKELTYMNYLVHHLKVLKDYLFLLILLMHLQFQIMNQVQKNNRKYFLPRGEINNYNVFMEEIFMTNKLIT